MERSFAPRLALPAAGILAAAACVFLLARVVSFGPEPEISAPVMRDIAPTSVKIELLRVYPVPRIATVDRPVRAVLAPLPRAEVPAPPGPPVGDPPVQPTPPDPAPTPQPAPSPEPAPAPGPEPEPLPQPGTPMPTPSPTPAPPPTPEAGPAPQAPPVPVQGLPAGLVPTLPPLTLPRVPTLSPPIPAPLP